MATTVSVGMDLRDFHKGINEMKTNLSDIGRTLGAAFAAVGAAVAAVGVSSLRAGEDARQALGGIQAQSGQTDAEIRRLDEGIRGLAVRQGNFTAQEMREGLAGITRNGHDADHQMRMLDAGMAWARASGDNLGTSLSTLDALMVKFGTEVEDVSKWVNTLAVAQQEMGISQTSMLDGLQRSAGIAQSAGLSYDFLSAALGIAYQNGMSMNTAATGLTGVFQDMISPTSNIRAAMEKLGVETLKNTDGTTDAQGSFINFIRTLYDADPAMREQIMNTMNLTGSNLDLFTNLLNNQDALEDLSGMFAYAQVAGDEYNRVTEMCAKRTGGLTEAFQQAKNVGREFLYQINDIIGARIYEWVRDATDGFKGFMEEARQSGIIEELAEAIMGVVESFIDIVKTITPIVIEWFPKLARITAELTKIVADNVEIVLGLWAVMKGYGIVKSVIGVFGGLKTAAVALAGKKGVGKLAPAMTEATGTKAGGGMLGKAGKLLKGLGPKGWAVLGITAGVAITIGSVAKQRQAIEDDYNAMYLHTGEKSLAMAYAAAQNMGRMSDEASSLMSELMNNYYDVFMEMYNTGKSKSEAMAAVVSRHFREQKDAVERELDELERSSQETWNRVYQETGSAVDATQAVAEAGYDAMKREAQRTLRQLRQDYEYYGEALPAGMQLGIDRGEPTLLSRMGDFASNIANRFKSFFGINSPSRLFTDYGENLGQGLQNGIDNSETRIQGAMTTISEAIRNTIGALPEPLRTLGTNAINGIQGGINAARQNVRTAADNVATSVRNGINTAVTQSNGWGQSIGSGLRNGLNSMRESISNTVSNIASSIGNGFRNVLGINSPSKVMIEIGEFTGEGVEVGLLNSVKSVYKAAATLTDAIIPDIRQIDGSARSSGSTAQSPSSAVINFEKMFDGAIINVRSDNDIRQLSQDIAWLTERQNGGLAY